MFVFVFLTCCFALLAPLFHSESAKKLPAPVWIPNNSISDNDFWNIYGLNSICFVIVILMSFGNELLFTVMLATASERLAILARRLISIPNLIKIAKSNKMTNLELANFEKVLIIGCIKEHQNTYL